MLDSAEKFSASLQNFILYFPLTSKKDVVSSILVDTTSFFITEVTIWTVPEEK